MTATQTEDIKTLPVFGLFNDQAVHQITLRSASGLEAKVLTWGGVIRDLSLPLANGKRQSLVLGFDSFDPYPQHSPYFGAIVGRYANRIAGGRFTLNGHRHLLDRNEAGRTTLHGGGGGFSHKIWRVICVSETSVTLGITSEDGDQGFPGTVKATCEYALGPANQLIVSFRACTDHTTPINLAQHTYFNLDGGADISNHVLRVFADAYTPVNPDQVPTGQVLSVDGTPFDFRQPTQLVDDGVKFDHNFVLQPAAAGIDSQRPAAELFSTKSGIRLRVHTTKPGMQFYDGHHINIAVPGSAGSPYGPRAGLCLETQFFPDSPNQSHFPNCFLTPDHSYFHQTTFGFDRRPTEPAALSDWRSGDQ